MGRGVSVGGELCSGVRGDGEQGFKSASVDI